METKKMSKSVRKFICMQKAQIRRQFWDVKKQSEMIDAMYRKLSGQQNPEEKLAEELVAKEKQGAKKAKAQKVKAGLPAGKQAKKPKAEGKPKPKK